VAAKQKRKREARLLAAGNTEALVPKVPLQQQTIDLPWNEEGSVDGAMETMGKRGEVTRAMRVERRGKIKEANFLKTMK
jgi:large subunit ribosomal protein L54